MLDLRLAEDIASCKSVIVIVGAGISVAAGSEHSGRSVPLVFIPLTRYSS